MANRKKGPALFEVIRAAQQKQAEQQRKDAERQAREAARQREGVPATGGTLKQAAAMLKSHGFWLGARSPADTPAIASPASPEVAPSRPAQVFNRGAASALPASSEESEDRPVRVFRHQPMQEQSLPPAQAELSSALAEDVIAHDGEGDEEAPSAFDHPAVSYVPLDDEPVREHMAGGVAAEPIYREVPDLAPAPSEVRSIDGDEIIDAAAMAPPSAEPIGESVVEHPVIEAPVRVPAAGRHSDAAAEAMRRVREEIAASTSAESEAGNRVGDEGFDALGYFKQHDHAGSAAPWYRRLPLRFGYATGIAAGVGLAVLGAIAVGVLVSGSEKTTVVEKRADVLDLKSTASVPVVAGPASARQADSATVGVATPRPVLPPVDAARVSGQQYLVLMSFKNEKDARVLAKFLADNGVAATVEHGLPRLGKWYAVMTVRGFAQTSNNAEFKAFEAELIRLMATYGRTSIYAAGKPAVYGWR